MRSRFLVVALTLAAFVGAPAVALACTWVQQCYWVYQNGSWQRVCYWVCQ